MIDPRFETPPAAPDDWLAQWLADGRQCGLTEPTAMSLATVDANGRPSNRIVLYKELRGADICFYTNYRSRKAQQLDANPHVAACFWWNPLMRQLRVEGCVSRLSDDESSAYFAGRPRGSQLGAWASQQSQIIPDRATLEAQFAATEQRFAAEPMVPRPIHWGGYRLRPERIEFWQGQDNRYHDRMEFIRRDDAWERRRLQP